MSAEEAHGDGAEKGKKKGGKLPLIIGIVAVVLALFVGKTVFGGKKPEETKKTSKKKSHSDDDEEKKVKKHGEGGDSHASAEEEEEEEEPEPAGEYVALEPEITVNLTGEGGHYLRVAVSVGLRKGFTKAQLEHHVAPVRDQLITIMSAKDLKTMNSAEGKKKLKKELIKKLNKVFHEEKEKPIVEVCFTSFATQ